MVRKFYGDPTRMKATKADDWDRKYHKALLKEQEPIWVASGVSVELQKFLAQLDKGGKYTLPAGGALELACGVGIDSAAIAQSATFSQRKVHGVDISENAVTAARARYVATSQTPAHTYSNKATRLELSSRWTCRHKDVGSTLTFGSECPRSILSGPSSPSFEAANQLRMISC